MRHAPLCLTAHHDGDDGSYQPPGREATFTGIFDEVLASEVIPVAMAT